MGGKWQIVRLVLMRGGETGHAERARRCLEVAIWFPRSPTTPIDVFFHGGHDGEKKKCVRGQSPTIGHF